MSLFGAAVVAPLGFASGALALMVLASLTMGFSGQTVKITGDTVLQRDIDDWYRGRVFALYDVGLNVSLVAGICRAAFTVPADGIAPMLWARRGRAAGSHRGVEPAARGRAWLRSTALPGRVTCSLRVGDPGQPGGRRWPVGMLDSFEKKFDRMVNGAFAKAFKSEVQPVEIAAGLQRELDDRATVVSRARTVVPNVFIVELSTADFAPPVRLRGHGQRRAGGLGARVRAAAALRLRGCGRGDAWPRTPSLGTRRVPDPLGGAARPAAGRRRARRRQR